MARISGDLILLPLLHTLKQERYVIYVLCQYLGCSNSLSDEGRELPGGREKQVLFVL